MKKQVVSMVMMSLVAMMALGLSSCNTKQHAIYRLEKFSVELRDHSAQYSVNEWKKAGEKFVDIRKDISKHEFDYTPDEKTKIGKLEGKCAGYMAKGMKEGVFDKLKAFGNELKGILMGILNSVID